MRGLIADFTILALLLFPGALSRTRVFSTPFSFPRLKRDSISLILMLIPLSLIYYSRYKRINSVGILIRSKRLCDTGCKSLEFLT